MREYVVALLAIAAISLLSVILTVYDKFAASHLPEHRIREQTLFFCAFLGGAAAMFITMVMIRHKTMHKRFMIGLPLIMLLHCAAMLFIILLPTSV